MTTLSLREAAEQTGVSKSTVFRAIRAGKLSAGRDEGGNFEIDPAELFRVFPPKSASSPDDQPARHGSAAAGTRAEGQHATDSEAVELRVRNASLEAEIRGLRDMAEELRRARDKWEQQAERAMLLLAAPKPAEPMPASVPVGNDETPVARRGWWPFRRAG
jgi:excisionase family DNA binding protein